MTHSIPSCTNCGASLRFHRRYDFETAAFRQIYTGRDVYRCENCNLSQVDTARVDDDALGDYYRADYRKIGTVGVLNDATNHWYTKRADALTRLAERYGPPETSAIFEVGAGYGYNLRALGEEYPAATLETDEVSTEANAGRGGAITQGDLGEARHDVIILSHVLEHFSDPHGLMERVARSLRPGGIVIIEVPNDVDGIERFNGPDEPHLTFFEEPTLRDLLDRVPLQTLALFTAGPSYVVRDGKRIARQALKWVLYRIPILSGMLRRRAARNVAALPDFAKENPQGLFLRAVLRKTAQGAC